jgi:extracellular elastinolytic metalloproteinase
MMPNSLRGHSSARPLMLFAALGVTAVIALPAAGAPLGRDRSAQLQGNAARGTLDVDRRQGQKSPTLKQKKLVGARGVTVRWNRFGTPQTLVHYGGYLAAGLGRDPVAAARRWLASNSRLLGVSAHSLAGLQLVSSAPIGSGRAVLFRQVFGGLPAGHDGLVSVGVVKGKITHVSSTLARSDALTGKRRLSARDAVLRAAADAGRSVSASDIHNLRAAGKWTAMNVDGFSRSARARLVALPVSGKGAVPAYETVLIDNEAKPTAVSSFVDARNGKVLVRENLVDYDGEPSWRVFPASPSLNYSSTDTRQLWCWTAAAGCNRALAASSPDLEWDVDPATSTSTFTTNGNTAIGVHNWFSNNPFTVGTETAASRPGRDYVYPWANQWYAQSCNPDTTFTSPERNDIDAARANLFAMHNRMHDWSYHLGFTEQTFNLQRDNFGRGGLGGDPEQGNAQAGGVTGGPASGFAARDNANQITPNDGQAPITNMYLWQPIAAAFYAPCVDGDFDMSVVGHEYTHAISNRMVAGPNAGLSGSQAGAMGESWSDLDAIEILNEYGFVPVADENRYAVGPYVTGDKRAGIRNYGMNQSPLNYSDVGYDFVCNAATCPLLTQVHADGEIWSATNFAIRQAMIARYGAGMPASQEACADGLVPVGSCPGNRRWIQLVFDAWLLIAAGNVSMLDARDAMLAADVIRFGGANQDLLWNVFASRGFGENAASNGTNDADPAPSFASPHATEATLIFHPIDASGAAISGARLFVGRYEARATPVADTDPATSLGSSVQMVAGTYELLAQAPGFGMKRLSVELKPGMVKNLQVSMPRNLASSANGATASGDGVNIGKLIDDTEATNWASLGSPVAGKQVTVRLDPSRPWWQVARVQVSAELRTRIPTDPADGATQSRFSALRSFEIRSCQVKAGVDCTQDSQFTLLLTSPADAFPSVAPRPRVPELLMGSFVVPKTSATYIRLRVLTNQCTGAPDYQGDLDDDPLNVTDCQAGSMQDDNVRAAELQVFQK